MITENLKEKKARFDILLTQEQKDFFERAAHLGGYRNLTDFVVSTVQQKATEIVDEREKILVSERDCEIFFDALANPPKPNKYLRDAAEAYKKLVSE